MGNRHSVYLDHSATTPVDERVLSAMLPYFSENFGNTSSAHRYGRKAEDAVETAREAIARIFKCKPKEIIFTSGGSESDNLAIRGAAWMLYQQGRGKHLITTPVEHSAVTRTMVQLTGLMGFDHTILPVDQYGIVDQEDFAAACSDQTTVASVVYANNEVGSVAPLAQIAQQAKMRNVLLHTDAVQAAGQLTLDVQALGVDMMSISAHKFYGPKGVGTLYCREGIELEPSQTGGSHERGRRAGTVNTPGIVGMAKALELAYEEHEIRVPHLRQMRDMLIDGVTSRIDGAYLTGHPEQRLPSHASFVIEGVDSNMLVVHLDMKGVAASSASACKTGNPKPSDVLLAMGYEGQLAMSSLRLSVGLKTTEEDVMYAVDVLVDVVGTLRKLKQGMVS